MNRLLTTAGFASVHPVLPRDDKVLAPLTTAIERMIFAYDPYPALVLDQLWTVVQMNRSASLLFANIGVSKGASILDMVSNLPLVECLIENWGEVGYQTLSRLRIESAEAGGIAKLDAAAKIVASSKAVQAFKPPNLLPPVIPTIYRAGGLRLSLFSTFTQFGTAEEINLSQTKIEMMFPADEATTALLNTLPIPQG